MIVAQEHIALVEMLAERVAALVLTHPRVVSVTVRVEKLDVGPGAVGVEIVRERPAEAAKVHHLFPVAAAESDRRQREMRDLTVVKLGGSHAFAPHLRAWLDAIAQCAGRIVVVPGGGPFADAVRDAQPRMGFDDAAAHRMALLAMEQYGCALASLNARFVLAESRTAIAGCGSGGQRAGVVADAHGARRR